MTYKTIAIIDIGTNSVKFCIAEHTNGKINTLLDTYYPTRIGEGFQTTGMISSSAMTRNLETIKKLCRQARELNVSKIFAIGTKIFRTATNADCFIQKVKSSCGVNIQVLSGVDEARLSYLGAVSDIQAKDNNFAVLDTGGGSSELTFGNDHNIYKRFSFDIGAVTLTESYLTEDPVKTEQLEQVVEHIRQIIQMDCCGQSIDHLIGSSGVVTTMAAVKFQMTVYNAAIIHGAVLTLAQVHDQIKMYASKTIDQRMKIPGLQKGREDIILAGACIVEFVMLQLKCHQLIVSDRGLRHGFMAAELIPPL